MSYDKISLSLFGACVINVAIQLHLSQSLRFAPLTSPIFAWLMSQPVHCGETYNNRGVRRWGMVNYVLLKLLMCLGEGVSYPDKQAWLDQDGQPQPSMKINLFSYLRFDRKRLPDKKTIRDPGTAKA